jgi:hypothetical protein
MFARCPKCQKATQFAKKIAVRCVTCAAIIAATLDPNGHDQREKFTPPPTGKITLTLSTSANSSAGVGFSFITKRNST